MGEKSFIFITAKVKPRCRWLLATESELESVSWLWELSWDHAFPRKVLECKLCPSNVGGNCIVLCLRCCCWVGIPKQAAPVFRCSRVELSKYCLILLIHLWSRLLRSFSLWLMVCIWWNIFPSENFRCGLGFVLFFFFPLDISLKLKLHQVKVMRQSDFHRYYHSFSMLDALF